MYTKEHGVKGGDEREHRLLIPVIRPVRSRGGGGLLGLVTVAGLLLGHHLSHVVHSLLLLTAHSLHHLHHAGHVGHLSALHLEEESR